MAYPVTDGLTSLAQTEYEQCASFVNDIIMFMLLIAQDIQRSTTGEVACQLYIST